MRKSLCVLVFSVILGIGLAGADPVDLIVLLDTSESMFPYFDDATNYLFKDILTQQLRQGDTFHLISFSDKPEIEISREISGPQDIDDITSRILLLQPLGPHTDLVLAVKYLYQYAVDLPLSSKKVILILTDGIHDPPPGSSFPNKLDANGVDISGNQAQIVDTANEIRRRGWEVHFLQFPLGGVESGNASDQAGVQLLPKSQTNSTSGGASGLAGSAKVATAQPGASGQTSAARTSATTPPPGPAGNSGQSTGSTGAPSGAATAASAKQGSDNLLRDLANTVGSPIQEFQGTPKEDLAHVATGAPGVTFPADLGTVGYETTIPFVIRNYDSAPILVQLNQILYNGENILKEHVSLPIKAAKSGTLRAPVRLPVTLRPGKNEITIDLVFADSARLFPHEGAVRFTLGKGIGGSGSFSLVLLPVLFAIVLIACIILVFLLIRRIVAGIGSGASHAARPQVHYETRSVTLGLVEMKVTGQNPNIGGRNIHPVGASSRRSVGGGGSAYLIYLFAFPPHIAELSHDGQTFVFNPLRAEFFPGLNGPLRDCLGKEIVLRTRDAHETRIVFRDYVSPLDQINRIMHLIDRPGKIGSKVAATPPESSGKK